jgi:hypothetical protein
VIGGGVGWKCIRLARISARLVSGRETRVTTYYYLN